MLSNTSSQCRAAGRLRALVSLLGVACAVAGCSPMDSALQAIFGRSMRDQNSFDPYENPLPPPDGAVSFSSGNHPSEPGQVNVGQPASPQEVLPEITPIVMAQALAGGGLVNEMANPVPATAESLARGKVVFDRMCAVCHGPLGVPSDAPILPKLPVMVAFPLASGGALIRTDGYLYGMITAGRGVMPAYGHQIAHFDRWNVVNYVRLLQGRVPAEGVAPATPGAAGGED